MDRFSSTEVKVTEWLSSVVVLESKSLRLFGLPQPLPTSPNCEAVTRK